MKIYYCFLFFILGSVLASFYGVVATRLPEGKSIIKPRSHCPSCQHPLKFYDLIPILSYIFSNGHCRYCHQKLPLYEPLSEVFLGLVFSASYLYYGFSYKLWMTCLISSLFLLIYISDFKYMIILDSPLIITGVGTFLLKWLYNDLKNSGVSLINGLILFFFFLFVAFIGKKMFKREALGGGDIKLAFIIGMILGIPYAFMALVLSTFLALPYATFSLLTGAEKEVPYGPFLVSALWMVFLFYDKFTYVLNLFS